MKSLAVYKTFHAELFLAMQGLADLRDQLDQIRHDREQDRSGPRLQLGVHGKCM